MKKHLLSILLITSPVIAPALADVSTRGFADIVAPVLDGVVNISATLRRQPSEAPDLQLPEGPMGDLFREFFSVLPKKKAEKPRNITSLGSGFVIKSSGLIVTNYHVVQHVLKEKGEIKVILNSGEELLASVVGGDFRSDLALLKVKPKKPLVALKWGDSQKMRVGDAVLAIGNPFGLGGTVTSGIVSHTKRNLPDKIGEATHVDQWIQTDASINQGSSGGPLLDVEGNVIGINTAIFTPTGGNIGIALAVPSYIARNVIDLLERDGCIKRGWIGIKLGDAVSEELASNLGMPSPQGVLIDDVMAKAPADQGGMKAGDVILKIDNQAVDTPSQLRTLVSTLKPGQTIEVIIWRKKSGEQKASDQKMTLKIKVQELGNEFCKLPSKDGSESSSILGLTLRSLQEVPSTYRHGIDDDVRSGVVVMKVDNNSPAIDKLRAGDIILEIGATPVQNPLECQTIIQTALKNQQKSVLLLIARPEEGKRNILVKISEPAAQ